MSAKECISGMGEFRFCVCACIHVGFKTNNQAHKSKRAVFERT